MAYQNINADTSSCIAKGGKTTDAERVSQICQ